MEYLTKQRPTDETVDIYLTPEATVTSGISFTHGGPSIEVSLEEFKAQSKDAKYTVFYPVVWDIRPVELDGYQAFYYLMKMPQSDVWLVAKEFPPNRLPLPYSDTITFDSKKGTFTLIASEDKMWFWLVVPLVILFAGVGLSLHGSGFSLPRQKKVSTA